jgi:hypothetical protein
MENGTSHFAQAALAAALMVMRSSLRQQRGVATKLQLNISAAAMVSAYLITRRHPLPTKTSHHHPPN